MANYFLARKLLNISAASQCPGDHSSGRASGMNNMRQEKQQQQEEFSVDFLKPHLVSKRILRSVGLWSTSPSKFFGWDFYTVYAVSILVMCNLQYAFEIAYWFLVPGDFETMASSGVVVFEKLQTNAKVFCIVRYQPMLKRFFAECNGKMFQPKTKGQAVTAKDVLRLYTWIYLAFEISAFCSTSALSFNLLVRHHEKAELPFVAWYPFNYTRHFWPTFSHQVFSTYVMAQTQVTVDCLSIGLLAFIVIQCDILADTIRNLKAITKGSLEASGRKNVDLVSETERQFYACVRHHKEILRWFQEIYTMLNLIVLAQYAASALTLCMTLIQASLVETSDPRFTTMVVYAAVIMGQLFMFCWWGNEVIRKSAEIPVAAFNSDWPEMSQATKKDLLTFVNCTQRPLELFAADYFKVSLENFTMIVKHSYSFFAVLHRMNS